MKQIASILLIFLFSQMAQAQQDSYDALWKKVQQFERDALTSSALKVVETISKKAHQEENATQIVKSLLYSSKYALILEEDAQLAIISDFRATLEKSDFPTKQILESYLANLFWQYFQEHRYQFYNRTKTETKVDSLDFRTWDLNTLFEEIGSHFSRSLDNQEALQKIKLSEYAEILNRAENSETYRPTLYDLLAHTALTYYKSPESNITRPADKFEIDSEEYLCEATPFTALKIPSEDGTSLQSKALKIYQDLLAFHLKDQNPDALVEVDIERLRFIHEHALFENKSAVYEEVLRNSMQAYKDLSVASLYGFEIAQLYNQQGNQYEAGKSELNRWKRKEALELCEQLIKAYPNSRGAQKSADLKASILSKELRLTAEQYIPTQLASKLLVQYKNHGNLNLVAHRISKKQLKKLSETYPIEKQKKFIQALPVAKQWNAELPNEGDYQIHSTEILLPPLNNGIYVILADTTDKGSSFAFGHVQVTNLALLEIPGSEVHRFQVIDRNNGGPIQNATVKLNYQVNYDRSFVTRSFETDKDGMITIPLPNKQWTSIGTEVIHNDEKGFFGEYYIRPFRKPSSVHRKNYEAFLFTDRSIYRPGQPLYFKGIAISRENDASQLEVGIPITVKLYDVNGQVVAEQRFETNDYGSFSGDFVLPSSGLTGNFWLRASSEGRNLNGTCHFSVEEYKRPKFETSFEPIAETFKVNDTIRIRGTAKSYAGSVVSEAKVVYRVKRIVYYPRWYYWRGPYYPTDPQEIAHGETLTDASGTYEISFKALPDKSAMKDGLPVFSYEVTADVTDINGETRSTSTVVRVGYHALTATMYLADRLDKQKEQVISISTNNLNGEFVPAMGTIKIFKLKAPEYVLRKRPWSAPDYKSFSKSEFKKLFPYEAYNQEHQLTTWEKGSLAYETSFDTEKSKEITLKNLKKWESGAYVVELETKDKDGQLVKDVLHTTLFSEQDRILADMKLFEAKTDKETYEVGEEVVLKFMANKAPLTVTVFVEKNRKIVATHLLKLNGSAKTIRVPVLASDLGGFAVSYSYAAFNSFESESFNIAVPYPTTQLQLETVTFRDKLLPGTDETWAFKIMGPKGEKVSAELLAGMYDASLDAFQSHGWSFNPIYRSNYYSYSRVNGHNCFGTNYFNVWNANDYQHQYKSQYFDSFNWFDFYFGYYYAGRRDRMLSRAAPVAMEVMEEAEADMAVTKMDSLGEDREGAPEDKKEQQINQPPAPPSSEQNNAAPEEPVAIRKNLQETAFFFPHLTTDREGNVSFSFTTPEALTRWKLQLLAHDKNLQTTSASMETVTQKELMVLPNIPRFLRQGDRITLSTKISNLSERMLSGTARLIVQDVITGNDVTGNLLGEKSKTDLAFEVAAAANTQVSWQLQIPDDLQGVQVTVSAKAGSHSDGEQHFLPVLTNRTLVTETLPMWIRSDQNKTFVLEKLRDNTSTTLKHHKLTLEITSNPAWYAVQALPYLMEYPYDCNEQTFAKYYANTLASYIANQHPKIKEVFNSWASSDALLSNLEKNEALKSLLIQETPWLRDAQSETEQKKRIALLFDLNKMKNEQARTLSILKQNQMSSGAWAWFKGGRANRYITQHIISGLGHLKKLGVTSSENRYPEMINRAISYLDTEFLKEYNQMKKYAKNLNDDHLSTTQIHYLYMRSFFKEVPSSKKVEEVTNYYFGQAKKYWVHKNLYSKGLLALITHRSADTATANKILRSLKENSIVSDELGMYWKENENSWFWYQAPIETQSLLIEAFSEIDQDALTVDNLKIWLLKNKQTNQWKTTKATSEAVYALLLTGTDWLSVTEALGVKIANQPLPTAKLEEVRVEAGTGYYKTSWASDDIKPELAEVNLEKKGEGIAWGALYWQYFEDLDKITTAETPLKLKKKLFLRNYTDTGEEISEINANTKLELGDLVRVRIELRVDRPMEFVHMKDMRAAGFEPINVLSRYKWQDGLGYYESTKDASTNFFFDYLPKGVFVFEYDLRVNNAGDFSNGITSIQSMYAPEFTSHSEGVRVWVQ